MEINYKQCDSEKAAEASLLKDELETEDDFYTMDFKTIMEAIVAQETDEIAYLKLAFDDLTDSIVLIDIIGGERLKIHYSYIYATNEDCGKDLKIIHRVQYLQFC